MYSDDEYSRSRSGWMSRVLLRQRVRAAVRYLRRPSGGMVVDVGAADGRATLSLTRECGWQAIALERSPELLAHCDDRAIIRVCGDAREAPLRSGLADAVVMMSVLKHIYRVGRALEESWRLLKPGGQLVVIEPAKAVIKLGGRLGYFDTANIANLWGLNQLRRSCEAAGFETIKQHHFALGLYQLYLGRRPA